MRSGKARIVVGARSALFAPVENLGIILVDEEHEGSYKQEEAPRYQARDVAVMRGRMHRAAVVLGSATPSVESYYNAFRGKYELVRLNLRVDDRQMPRMRVIDMRLDTGASGRPGILSRDLVDAVRLRMDRGEQTMLFLNRRGFSTSMICPTCGHVAACPHCSVSLTYHRHAGALRCHYCGESQRVPDRCPNPECRDPAFKFSGTGTERVEAIIRQCFPRASIQRMDRDTMTAKDSYRKVLGDFRTGKIDILVGTQMIAKGLHFPNVTLVGVINADTTLHLPDFRAAERAFQLLTQVAGRAGRGEIAGEVIVQTFTPTHVAIQSARRIDYEGFFDQELEARRELGYPPFGHLVVLTVRGPDEAAVAAAATAFHERLKPLLPANVVLGEPGPAPLARLKGSHRHQIVLRGPTARGITTAYRRAAGDFKLPKGVLMSIDVDAQSMA
ncbi:MAG: primosomal protein N' [Kiritimatiellia bacterium]